MLLVAAAVAFAFNAANWLKEDDAPIKADVIVVLAGRYERAMHAADLYRAGYAPTVVLSEAVPDPSAQRLASLGIRLPAALDIQHQVLLAKKVPADHIAVLGAPALSTVDEAEAIAHRFGQAGRRLIVVTSPSHVRRARLILERALVGRGVELVVSATPYDPLPGNWWESQDAAREVLLEWTKIFFYQAGGRFRATP